MIFSFCPLHDTRVPILILWVGKLRPIVTELVNEGAGPGILSGSLNLALNLCFCGGWSR